MANARMLEDARDYLQAEDLPGWLIYDYLGCNPVLAQVAQPSGHVTRPVFLFVPAAGSPRLLTHHVDAGKFADAAGEGTDLEQVVYSSRVTLESALQATLSGCGRVAMEYSPRNGLPRVSRVDAGTVELVQSMGADVVSSADLMQYATQRWSPDQLAGHKRAAEKLARIVNEAFARIGQRLNQPESSGPTEFEIAEFIRARFREEGLVTADGPIVSTNAHCSDPHYEPAPEGSSVIAPGDWILIDLWAREDTPGSVYADITWTAYVGDTPTDRHRQVFDIVLGARDAALSFLQDSFARGEVHPGLAGGRRGPRLHRRPRFRRVLHPPPGPQHLPHRPRRGRQPGQLRDPRHPPHHPRHRLLHRAGHLSARVRRPLRDRRLHERRRPLRLVARAAGHRAYLTPLPAGAANRVGD